MVGLIGSSGEIIIAAGLIISVCGAYLSWTIMAAEVPYIAAQYQSFPKIFNKLNKNDAPSSSLWLTNGAVQLSLVLIWLSGSNYNTLLTIASEMILVPYFLVGAFLIKVAFERHNKLLLMVGMVASLYGLWLLYASGLINLMLSVVLYAPGILVFGMRELSNPNKLHLIWLKRLSLWLLSRGSARNLLSILASTTITTLKRL